MLLVASAWIGLVVLVRVEWVAILCACAFIAHALPKARTERADRPLDSVLWGFGSVLAIAIGMAGAFDLLDLGRGSQRSDWETGFLFGAALALPIALAHAWVVARAYRRARAGEAETGAVSGLPENARLGVLICTALGVTILLHELIGSNTTGFDVFIVASAGCATMLCSLLHQRITDRWGSVPQLLAQLFASLAVSYGLLAPTVAAGLGMFFLGFAVLRAVDHIPSSASSSFARLSLRLLDAARYGLVTMLVGAGAYLGVAGGLGARDNLTVADVVSNMNEAMPLSGAGFANLIMTDEYLWADTVPRNPGWQIFTLGKDPVAVVENLRFSAIDQWSDAMAEWIYHAFDVGLQFGLGVEFAPADAGDVVAYVHPGSAADRAGVRRGWRMLQEGPDAQNAAASGRTQVFEDTSGKRWRLELSFDWREVPTTSRRIFEADGRRIGYLLLWEFSGPAEDELERHFAAFREQGIDELVVDLRYNPGGRLSTAKRLAELIAGERVDGAVFQRVLHNARYSDSNQTVRLRRRPNSLAVKRVFFLTTAGTCSASEAVINGLAPHIEVVAIGERTCGKPVGYQAKTFRDVTYGVISFRLENSRGEGEYFHGLAPTCRVAEDFRAELGWAGDPLFDTALSYIRTGGCP